MKIIIIETKGANGVQLKSLNSLKNAAESVILAAKKSFSQLIAMSLAPANIYRVEN